MSAHSFDLSIQREIRRRVADAVGRQNQTLAGIPRLTEEQASRLLNSDDPIIHEWWSKEYHAHTNHQVDCAGSIPIEPLGFAPCENRAICTWNDVPYCAECAPEGPCDGERREIDAVMEATLLGGAA